MVLGSVCVSVVLLWLKSAYEFYVCFFQAENGIRDFCLSRGLGDVCKRQVIDWPMILAGV